MFEKKSKFIKKSSLADISLSDLVKKDKELKSKQLDIIVETPQKINPPEAPINNDVKLNVDEPLKKIEPLSNITNKMPNMIPSEIVDKNIIIKQIRENKIKKEVVTTNASVNNANNIKNDTYYGSDIPWIY